MLARKKFLLAAIVTAALGLNACSIDEKVERAGAEVTRFHARLNANDFGGIYDSASEQFKKSASKEEIVRFLRDVRSTFGAVTQTRLTHWHLNYDASGTFLVLTYETSFDSGRRVLERFNYLMTDPTPKLVGYTIDTPGVLAK